MTKITFANTNNPNVEMSAILNLPEGFDEGAKYPAIVVSHPGGPAAACVSSKTPTSAPRMSAR